MRNAFFPGFNFLTTGTFAVAAAVASPAIAATLPGTTLTPSVWFDASQIVSATDGQTLAVWKDVSGNGRDASQPAAINDPLRLPTYRANVVNGLPTVRFNNNSDAGSSSLNQFLAFNGALANSADANLDLYVVTGSTDPVITGRGITVSTRPAGASGGFVFGYNTSDTVAAYFHPGPGYAHGGNAALGVGGGSVHTQNIRQTPADPMNFTLMALDRTGLSEDFATFTDGGAVASNVTWNNFAPSVSPVTYIATQNQDHFFRGDIAEIIAFEGGIDAAARRQVIGYLGQKYGITSAAALIPEPTGIAMLVCAAGGLLVRRRAR